MTELATTALNDGQTVRPFINYFAETFQDIKGKEFSFSGEVYNTEVEFINALTEVLQIWGNLLNESNNNINLN